MTPTAGAVRGSPGFRRYLASRVATAAGALITAVVLPVLLYRITGSAGWTSAAVAAEALPYLVLAPFAPGIVGRVTGARLLPGADLTVGALLFSIPVAWWSDVLSGWQVLAVACAVQAVFVLLATGHGRALPALVGSAATAEAGTAIRAATWLVELMAPPLAGLAVAIAPPPPLLALDAVTFLASAFLVRGALRSPRDSERAGGSKPARRSGRGGGSTVRAGAGRERRRSVRSGLSFLNANPPARRLAVVRTLHAAAAAAYLAVLLPWADLHLDVPPSGDARLALLISSWGLGSLVACSVAQALTRRFGSLRLVRYGLLGSWACALGVLVCPHWLPAVFAGLVWGTAHMLTTQAGLEALGRPARSAARWLWRGVGPVSGATVAGIAAVNLGPRAGLAVAAALLTVAVVALGRGASPAPEGYVPEQPGPAPQRDKQGERPAQRPVTGPQEGRAAEPDPTGP